METTSWLKRPRRCVRSAALLALPGLALAVVLLLMQFMAAPQLAYTAPTINVTTTQDQFGTGTACALREAVQSINTGSSFGGCDNPGGAAVTIQLQPLEYTLTISKTGDTWDNSSGGVVARTSMTVVGAGMDQTVIKADPTLNDFVFGLYSETGLVAFGMYDLTIQDGLQGGIRTHLAESPTDGSSLEFGHVIVQNNTGSEAGIRMMNAGDPVHVSFDTVLVQNNGTSGGIRFFGGVVTMESVTLYNNRNSSSGGGIHYWTNYSQESLHMTNVTVFSNAATYNGGGLYASNGRTVTATNSTFAGNYSATGGGNIYHYNTTINLVNTIVSDGYTGTNIANNCAGNPTASISSLGHNIEDGNSCGLTGPGDQLNTDPQLAAGLADNGGSIPTLALLNISPAIDAGDDSACPAQDARDLSRPQGPHCDIGAYEYKSPTADALDVDAVWNQDHAVQLEGQIGAQNGLTFHIDSLPSKGALYQYDNGSRGAEITSVPQQISDAGARVFFVPVTGEIGSPYTSFDYYVMDGNSASNPATVRIWVSGQIYLPIVIRET